jgi:hypothetical protein
MPRKLMGCGPSCQVSISVLGDVDYSADCLSFSLPPVIYCAHFTFQKYIGAQIDPPKLSLLSSTKGQSLAENVDPRLALMFALQVK